MKAMKVLITLLTVLGAVGIIAGGFVILLISYTGRDEFIAFPIVCIVVGIAAIVASAIVRSIYIRKMRNGGDNVVRTARSAPAATAYTDPFGDFPDGKHKRNIDPFGFDAPARSSKTDGEANASSAADTAAVAGDKYCEHCGAKRVGTDKFCPYCGHRYNDK